MAKKLLLSYESDGSWQYCNGSVEYSFQPDFPETFSGFMIEIDAEQSTLNIMVNGSNLLIIRLVDRQIPCG